jgi:hypothetical protein
MNEEEKDEKIRAIRLMKKGLNEYKTKNSWGIATDMPLLFAPMSDRDKEYFDELIQENIKECFKNLARDVFYDEGLFPPLKINKSKEPVAVPAEENDDITLER